MRRRVKRRRYAGLILGATLFTGIATGVTVTDRHVVPGPPLEPAALAAADAAPSTAPPRPAPPLAMPWAEVQAAGQSPSGEPPQSAVEAAPDTVVQPAYTVEARPGDTPLKLLTRMGVAPEDAQAAIRKLSTVWDPRDLRAGQKAAVFVQSDRLLSIRLALAPGRDVVVARDDSGGFVAEDQERPTNWVATLGTGSISTSLSEGASRAGVPMSVLDQMVQAFSYDVDFQREIRPGDSFTMLYQRVHDEFGRPTGMGKLVYAELMLSGTRLRLYQFTTPNGESGYFNAIGENIKKPLLRTPVDAIRITSGFGYRMHPILGYSRMHRGVDFGAAMGTRVYAAGDGVVTRAGRVSGYGNYIEITHNQQYATAYGHLSGYGRGIAEGAHVRQGEVIGYVGMTGTATGPHLHYEVHDHGTQIDPLTLKMPSLTRLADDDLKGFQAMRDAIDRQLLEMRQDLVAHAACGSEGC